MARTSRGTGENNRRKILAAAAALIAEQGVEKTSLARIAQRAGLSKGTLYYYYSHKTDLVFDLTQGHMDKITRDILKADGPVADTGIDPVAESPLPREKFKALLTAYFTLILGNLTRSRLHLYLIREAMAGDRKLKQRFQDTYAHWFSLIDQAQNRHLPPSPHTRLRSKCLVALVEGFILQGSLEVEKTEIAQMTDLALNLLLAPEET